MTSLTTQVQERLDDFERHHYVGRIGADLEWLVVGQFGSLGTPGVTDNP